MKTTFVRIALMLCILSLIAPGCKKDTDKPLEVPPKKNIHIYEAQVDNLTLRFCLLNEWKEPANFFKEGRNFIFSFTIRNDSNDTITIPTDFINSEFYRVYQTQGKVDMGKPWSGIWCEKSFGPHIITVPPGKTQKLNCPWMLTYFQKPNYPLCINKSKDPLPKGEYFTKLDLNLQYIKKGKKKLIDYLNYQIDFEIE